MENFPSYSLLKPLDLSIDKTILSMYKKNFQPVDDYDAYVVKKKKLYTMKDFDSYIYNNDDVVMEEEINHEIGFRPYRLPYTEFASAGVNFPTLLCSDPYRYTIKIASPKATRYQDFTLYILAFDRSKKGRRLDNGIEIIKET